MMREESTSPTFAPLDPFPGEKELLSPLAQRRWLMAFLVVGVLLRLTRYLLRFPLWEDEAMLSANLIDRGYGQLLQPLHYCQVAPTLFLWGQLTIVRLLGFNEYSLRLIPFLCGLASLPLFRHVAGRLLQGVSLLLAVALFAVAYPMTRYAAEAKPYGCDLLVALVLLALAIEWLRRPEQTRWLWALAAVVGPAVGYSFPAIFVAGGVSAVIFCWKQGAGSRERGARSNARLSLSPSCSSLLAPCSKLPAPGPGTVYSWSADGTSVPATMWIPWTVYNLILVGSFAAVLIVSKSSVGETNQQTMEDVHWANTFPPLTQPLKLPLWMLETHAGAMLGYPVGGPNWGSTFSLLCVIVGLVALVRRRQGLLLGLLLAPLGLNFIAAALHRFPYGGHARMTLFLAPAFCSLIAVGLTDALCWLEAVRRGAIVSPALGRTARWSRATIALALLIALGAGSWLRDVTQPYKSTTTLRAREFAQWFWFELANDSVLVSCETDMQTDLAPGKLNCGWSALYFCNQRIYSPRHARGEKPQLGSVSFERPLRCVLYRSPKEEQESPPGAPGVRQRWLEKMETDYDLSAHDTYPFAAYDKSDRRQLSDDYVEVFKFVPKGGSRMAAVTQKRK
jgi:hypothetical protein